MCAIGAGGRSGSFIHDRRLGERIAVASAAGPRLERREIDELYEKMIAAALDADVAMLTGPQPPDALSGDFYRRIATDIRANGTPVVADLSGPALLGALEGGIDLLKISNQEVVEEGLAQSLDRGPQIHAMRELRDRGARAVLLSRAADPALLLVDDHVFELVGPRFEPADPTGSGEAMFAAVGVALAGGVRPVDAARLGVAAGALNVTQRGLGTGHVAEIDRLVEHISALELPERALRAQRVPTRTAASAAPTGPATPPTRRLRRPR